MVCRGRHKINSITESNYQECEATCAALMCRDDPQALLELVCCFLEENQIECYFDGTTVHTEVRVVQ